MAGRDRVGIGNGLLVFVGITHGDTADTARALAAKTLALRLFPDANGQMNRSVTDVGGDLLVISQFTLYADTRKGNRPSFVQAAEAKTAERLYHVYVSALQAEWGPDRVQTGCFGAHMDVDLVNDGPVTIELERSAIG